MADVLVDQGQQPVLVTAGDDLSLPLHLTVKKTYLTPEGNVATQKYDFPIQDTDTITVCLPPNVSGDPEIVITDVTITDANRGKLLANIHGVNTAKILRGSISSPVTFKVRLLRAGKRSTFVFGNLLIVKDDDYNPFQ